MVSFPTCVEKGRKQQLNIFATLKKHVWSDKIIFNYLFSLCDQMTSLSWHNYTHALIPKWRSNYFASNGVLYSLYRILRLKKLQYGSDRYAWCTDWMILVYILLHSIFWIKPNEEARGYIVIKTKKPVQKNQWIKNDLRKFGGVTRQNVVIKIKKMKKLVGNKPCIIVRTWEKSGGLAVKML